MGGDDFMYSPKIREEFVRAMYQIKQKTGVSIVKQANKAIEEYLKTKGDDGNGIRQNLSKETQN